MKIILHIFFFLWELPQNIIGLFLLFSYLKKRIDLSFESKGTRLFINAPIAISLGSFIFWNTDLSNDFFILSKVNKFHEYGHSIQSIIFGPMYLIIIGIPSSIRVLYARYYKRKNNQKWMNYYMGFPEKWADKLGKVDSTKGIFI